MLISDFTILQKILKPCKIYNLYHFRPVKAFSIDSRSIKKGEAFIAIRGQYHDGHFFIQKAVDKGASLIIGKRYVPTGFKIPFFVVENGYEALKATAAYVRKVKKPFVYGISGSVGKTTTKEILGFLLEKHFKVLKNKKTENNILGLAKTIFALKDEKVLILELGTNQKGEIADLAKIAIPNIGIITFVKPVHLKGLKSLEGVLKEKITLFKANRRMKAILNRDDPVLSKVKIPNKTYWFGKSKNNDLFARLENRDSTNVVFLIQNKYTLKLPFYLEGFISNFLAAILAARSAGLALEELVSRAGRFRNFPDMRMQMKQLGRYYVLNDAYNANPYSFQEAFRMLKNYTLPKIAVIGDMLELDSKSVYYHERLASQIIKSNFEYCLTFGKYTLHLKRRLQKLGYRRVFHFTEHKAIAKFIEKKIQVNRDSTKRYLIFLKGSRKMELEKVLAYLG